MRRLIISVTLIFVSAVAGLGQLDTQNAKNTVDQSMRSVGRVNPSTLGMEFDLPIGAYKGRGFDLPLGLSYSSKVWRFEEVFRTIPSPGAKPGDPFIQVDAEALFAEDSIAGWSSSLSRPYIAYTGAAYVFDGYGRPLPRTTPTPTNFPSPPYKYIRRVTIFLSGGQSHELRAQDAPLTIPNNGTVPPNSTWEGSFYATDGSGLKYVQDSNSDLFRLYFPDGSYYDFSTSTRTIDEGPTSLIVQMPVRYAERLTDADGNFVQYNLPDTQTGNDPYGSWTDQLGRVFPVMMPSDKTQVAWRDDIEINEVNDSFVLPGMTEAYTLRWRRLDAVFANAGYAPRPVGAAGPTPSPSPLFPSNIVMSEQCSSPSTKLFVRSDTWDLSANEGAEGMFDPMVLAEIELPNGAVYRFKYNEYGEIEKFEYPLGGREEFDYSQKASLAHLSTSFQKANRGVTESRIYESDEDNDPVTSTYSAGASDLTYKTTVVRPDGTKTENFMHRGYKPVCQFDDATNQTSTRWGYDTALAGRTFETRTFSSDDELKQRTVTIWAKTDDTNVPIVQSPAPINVQMNARVESTQTVTYEGDDGVSAVTETEYADTTTFGSPLNVILKKEYGYTTVSDGDDYEYGATASSVPPPSSMPTPGTLLRKTETMYETGSNYTNRNILETADTDVCKDG